MDCVICSEPIKPDANGWDGGHNAYPVAKGQCCGDCNDRVVTVQRLVDVGMTRTKALVTVANFRYRGITDLYDPEDLPEGSE